MTRDESSEESRRLPAEPAAFLRLGQDNFICDLSPSGGGGLAMCDWCLELEDRIKRCRLATTKTTDETMLGGLALLIEQYEAQKLRFHANDASAQPARKS